MLFIQTRCFEPPFKETVRKRLSKYFYQDDIYSIYSLLPLFNASLRLHGGPHSSNEDMEDLAIVTCCPETHKTLERGWVILLGEGGGGKG